MPLALRHPTAPCAFPLPERIVSERGFLRRWGFCLTAMTGLHAAALAAAVNGLSGADSPELPRAVMAIELAPLQPAPAAPQVRPERRPKAPSEATSHPVARPKAKPRPVTAQRITPPAPLPVSLPAAAAPVADEPAPQPEPMAAPTPANADAIPNWQGEVLAHLERHKRYPRSARLRRAEGVTVVRFVMDRDGKVVSVRLERSSGSEPLDEEGLALLDRAQPLPPPPQEVAGASIELVVPVQFQLR